MDVDGERQPGVIVVAREQFAHVAGAGEAGEPGAVLERVGQLGRGHSAVFDQPQQEAGVDAARPRRHHDAVERREAHRGVDRAPAGDRAQRRARAEVAGDEPRRVGRELRDAPRGVGVREAVEAEPAPRPLSRQRVRGRRRRQRGVERGVEACGRTHARERVDRRQRTRLVQRREVGQLLQPRAHPLVDPDRRPELLATVHDTVRDGVDLRQAVERIGRERAVARPLQPCARRPCDRPRRAPAASGCSSPR